METTVVMLGPYRDNGRENGSYYNLMFPGSLGMGTIQLLLSCCNDQPELQL